MTRVVYRPAARRDFIAIGRYIARRNPARARTFKTELRQRCDDLIDFPERGSKREDIGPTILQLVHGNYVVLYRYDAGKDRVYILRAVEGHLISSDFKIE